MSWSHPFTYELHRHGAYDLVYLFISAYFPLILFTSALFLNKDGISFFDRYVGMYELVFTQCAIQVMISGITDREADPFG